VLVIGSWQMLLFQATAFLKNWGQALSTQQSIDNKVLTTILLFLQNRRKTMMQKCPFSAKTTG